MPATTTIDRDQRQGLYALVRNHLTSIEDFWLALHRRGDFATAERLGREFAADFRLLQDIGWGESDERETFDLTMPAQELVELLKRLHDEARALAETGELARLHREDTEAARSHQLAYETCRELLSELEPGSDR